MSISAVERADAIKRAEAGLAHLHRSRRTSRSQLGVARNHVNLVFNLTSASEVWDSVHAIEALVFDVYDGVPTTATA